MRGTAWSERYPATRIAMAASESTRSLIHVPP